MKEFTIKEASKYIDKSESWIRKKILSNQLEAEKKAFKYGQRYKITKEALDNFVKHIQKVKIKNYINRSMRRVIIIKKYKFSIIILSILLVISLFSGCSGENSSSVITIETINSIDDDNVIEVEFGTSKSEALPSIINVLLSNNKTANISVNWNDGEPVYDKNTAGTYTFTGILDLSDTNYTNPNDLMAAVDVEVDEQANNDPEINLIKSSNNLEVTLTGTVTDSDSTVEKVVVDWGDGNTDTITSNFDNIDQTHIYASSGDYTITVTATDDDSAVSSEIMNVTVEANQSPTIEMNTATDNLEATLTGTVTDSDGSISSAVIDWGDGNTTTISSGFDSIDQTHTYTDSGEYTITVTATDDDGAVSSEIMNVTVEANQSPTIEMNTATDNLEATLTGTVTDSDGTVEEVSIDWGDGNTTTISSGFDNISKNHSYSSGGTYTVNVSATDDDSAVSSETISVTVERLGTRDNPAEINDIVNISYDDWLDGYVKLELQLKEIISGNEAWNIIYDSNQFNEEPEPDEEYIMAKFYIKIIELEEEPYSIYPLKFDAVSENGVVYDWVSVVVDNELDTDLYEGASTTGYVCFLVNKTDNPYAVFERTYNHEIWFDISN